VLLHGPAGHHAHAAIVRQAAGWLRCRVVETAEGQHPYTASPVVTGVQAFTIGGTVESVNAEVIVGEVLGESEGVPAQRLALRRRPVVAGERALDHVVEVGPTGDAGGSGVGGVAGVAGVAGVGGWQAWEQVEDFAASGPDDRHFVIDETAGEVVFGPAVREPDGNLRCFGAVPPKGAVLRLRAYRCGGGEAGNVARGAIRVVKSSIPYVDRASNRSAAVGGTDGEQIENAKLRGPLLLRTRQRAVTPEDYENLAAAAAPEVARVHCVPVGAGGAGAGGAGGQRGVVGGEDGVRVLIVPHAEDGSDGIGPGENRLEFHQLMLGDATYERVTRYLDERRTIGARVVVQPPNYVGLTVVTRLRARPDVDVRVVEQDALTALYGYFHPLRGGGEGTGWPFGRSVVGGEVYVVLQGLPGVELVEEVRLFPANPIERTRQGQVDRLEIGPHELVFSWGHQVMVQS
jgi:predicted phage baseplate assembly protein